MQQRPLGLTIAALLEGLLGLFLLVLVLPLAGLSALRLALGAAADAELLAAAGIAPFVVAALYTALGLAAPGTAWGAWEWRSWAWPIGVVGNALVVALQVYRPIATSTTAWPTALTALLAAALVVYLLTPDAPSLSLTRGRQAERVPAWPARRRGRVTWWGPASRAASNCTTGSPPPPLLGVPPSCTPSSWSSVAAGAVRSTGCCSGVSPTRSCDAHRARWSSCLPPVRAEATRSTARVPWPGRPRATGSTSASAATSSRSTRWPG